MRPSAIRTWRRHIWSAHRRRPVSYTHLAKQALTTGAADLEAFFAEPWAGDTSLTVKEQLSSMISIIGENMNIRRFRQMHEENGFIESYIHAGGKIGVLVDICLLYTSSVMSAFQQAAKRLRISTV